MRSIKERTSSFLLCSVLCEKKLTLAVLSKCQPVKPVISGSFSTHSVWEAGVQRANCCFLTPVHVGVNCSILLMLIAHNTASCRDYFFGFTSEDLVIRASVRVGVPGPLQRNNRSSLFSFFFFFFVLFGGESPILSLPKVIMNPW